MTVCLNGGTLFEGVCVCPPMFTGSTCNVRICLNGGAPNGNGGCTCLGEFTGGSCETRWDIGS